MSKNHYRSIFISDFHLGTRGCSADDLVDFLKKNHCDELYLVGDIIDGWRMKKNIYWPQSHSEVIRQILKKASQGTRVKFIVGNHDEFLRRWLPWNLALGHIKFMNRYDFISATGERYLVVHGDMFDNLMRAELKWIMHVGDFLYNFLIWLNRKFNSVRGWLGLPYWSLSRYLKNKTKRAVNFIEGFETKLAEYARQKGYHGVICGHIHQANITQIDGVHYLNSGDWVESCTAIVETHDGQFSIVEWK